jgi:SAM-dependent methyltransferase
MLRAAMSAPSDRSPDQHPGSSPETGPVAVIPFPVRSKLIYGLAIFISAFLLFQVQPLVAKIILPWFGGAAAVWIVCLLFFQVVLLLGYFYSHLLSRSFRPRGQSRIHAALLAASLFVLPILPKSSWKPTGVENPVPHILLLLTLTVGLPYFLLSSTSPLLQSWYAGTRIGAIPYRFYALSNIGSVLALLSYPVLIEPYVSTSHQAIIWSIAYAAFAIICAAVGLFAHGERRLDSSASRAVQAGAPDRPRQLLWVALTACASALLLAITNHITQNIASVPLLWVIPLSLYLFSFILCFDVRGWYNRALFLRLLGIALGAMAYALAPSFTGLPFNVLIPLYCAGLFIACMFCHGELARLKPDPAYLTKFYSMCSLGGALGAVFVALIAPHIFPGYFELHVAMAFCAVLVLIVNHRDPESPFYNAHWQPEWLVLVGLVVIICASLAVTAREQSMNTRLMVRNFYGVLRVFDESTTSDAPQAPPDDTGYRVLMNGTINHGLQFQSPARRDEPTAYYGRDSGIGIALKSIGDRGPLRVGVIGLGAGTIAAYARPGDRYTFYEINPLVVQVTRQNFTFMQDSHAQIDIVMGDARLSLEQEPPQGLDLLAVDAFSGDSIPVHLLTREAFELYFRHLKPDGLLAVHVSNNYLNLAPVVQGSAAFLNKHAVIVNNPEDRANGISRSSWVLIGNQAGSRTQSDIEGVAELPARRSNNFVLWTDDYNSLFKILK